MVQPSTGSAIEIARFRAGIAGYLAALVVQFWLGMWVNLFVEIPKNHPGANPPEYFSGSSEMCGGVSPTARHCG